jgi:hypothetical protein
MTDDINTTKLIEGKVASVLNERELAINVGAEQGVTPGMKFKVLANQPTEILDPETGESLGSIDRHKVKVKAVDVQARFSVCRTYKTHHVGDWRSVYLGAAFVGESREVVETLKAEDSTLPSPLSEEESYVKKGDRVVQLLKDDD